MKSFHDFLKEDVPTNAANAVGTQGGYGQDATATGPVAGYTERLFPNCPATVACLSFLWPKRAQPVGLS